MSSLSLKGVTKHYAGVIALAQLTLSVASGERRAIIGPNGAGKSTLFHLITGHTAPTQGEIYFEQRQITSLTIEQRVNLGLGYTFQRNNLFPGLSVMDNLRLAVQHQQRVSGHMFKTASRYETINEEIARLLQQINLSGVGEAPVKTLAYGQQRVLEVGLALATRPKLLLLDEPTAGMSPVETAEMVHLIQALPRSLTLLIVEHDMDVVFSLADQITVLHYGQVIGQGSPAEIRADPLVQEIYLGFENRVSC
jgi:branched-chain amino acid transport system ATP-binding protein